LNQKLVLGVGAQGSVT